MLWTRKTCFAKHLHETPPTSGQGRVDGVRWGVEEWFPVVSCVEFEVPKGEFNGLGWFMWETGCTPKNREPHFLWHFNPQIHWETWTPQTGPARASGDFPILPAGTRGRGRECHLESLVTSASPTYQLYLRCLDCNPCRVGSGNGKPPTSCVFEKLGLSHFCAESFPKEKSRTEQQVSYWNTTAAVLYTCVSLSDPSIFLRPMHGVVIVTSSSYLFGHARSCSFSKNLHATLLALLSLLQHLQSSRGKIIPFQFCAPAFSLGTNSPWVIHGDIGYHGTATEIGPLLKQPMLRRGGETLQFSHKRSGPEW